MKIGITTIFRGNTNYGGMLQAFALVQAIKNLGFHNVEQINFEYNRNPIYPSLLSRCSQYSIRQIIAKMMELSVERKYSLIEDKLNKRLSLFEQFLDTQIPKSKLYKANNHAQIGKDYDVLITGSDQVWNPNVVRDVFVFDFPTEAKKIAYAASIARNALSKKEKAYMLPRIAKFDHIGMREKTGKNILAREGISSSVVLDPTMLLDSKQWNRVTSPRLINGKYVLIYSFSDCKQKNNILDFYKKQGIQTVLIPYAKMKYNSYDGGGNFNFGWDVGPAEFLSLIKYADHVFTDSFHGTVFSILFEKEFTVFERAKRSGKVNMNSRLTDLLETFNLKEMLVSDDEFPSHHPECNYTQIDAKLDKLRKESLAWLKNSIEG